MTRKNFKRVLETIIPGPLDDEEIRRISEVAPAFYGLVEARASGTLPNGRRATDVALRAMRQPLLNYLIVESLKVSTARARGSSPLAASVDLCAYAAFLRFLESEGGEDFDVVTIEEQIYEWARRFSNLVWIEATRRNVERPRGFND